MIPRSGAISLRLRSVRLAGKLRLLAVAAHVILLPSCLLRLVGGLVVCIRRSQLGREIRDHKKHLVSSSAKVKGIIAR